MLRAIVSKDGSGHDFACGRPSRRRALVKRAPLRTRITTWSKSGYAFNHDGTCLYFAAASIFLAQAVGLDLSLGQQLGLLGILLVTSKGGAGVAGSAIVVLVSTLAATDTVPVAAVGIILGVHRLMSSGFVAVNILGNALATIVIASWEGAVDRKVLIERLELGPG